MRRKALAKKLIVVASLEEVDAIVANEIHEAMLLGDPARPSVGSDVLEGFRLAYSDEGVAKDGVDEIENAESHFPVLGYPRPEVFDEFGLEDGLTPLSSQGRPPPGAG
jgi:hypothetical protein